MQRLILAFTVLLAIALPSTLRADGQDFSRFAGPWHSGSVNLSVDAGGTVWFVGGPFINPTGRLARTTAQLTTVVGDTAYGFETDAETAVPFVMTLLPGGMMISDPYDGANARLFCGPNLDQEIAVQLIGYQNPCGA